MKRETQECAPSSISRLLELFSRFLEIPIYLMPETKLLPDAKLAPFINGTHMAVNENTRPAENALNPNKIN